MAPGHGGGHHGGGHHGGHHGGMGMGRPPMHRRHRHGCLGFIFMALASVAAIIIALI